MLLMALYEEKGLEPAEYREYIESPAWKYRAEIAKKNADNRCQLCHVSGYVKPLHAHHNTYERLGNERDSDIVVLCADCHKAFHESGIKVGRRPKLPKELFSAILRDHGITYTNDDPYRYYEKGKRIIQHILDGIDPELYDYYNSVNSEILYAAIDNQDKASYESAKANDWGSYEGEQHWREEHDYWVGWRK